MPPGSPFVAVSKGLCGEHLHPHHLRLATFPGDATTLGLQQALHLQGVGTEVSRPALVNSDP